MKNAKIWLITLGIVVGACLLGWLVRSAAVRDTRADILARARAAKARKQKEARRSTDTETKSEEGSND